MPHQKALSLNTKPISAKQPKNFRIEVRGERCIKRGDKPS